MLYICKKDNNYIQLVSDDTKLIDRIESNFTYRKIVFLNNNGTKRKKIYNIPLLEERSLLPFGLLDDLITFLNSIEYKDYEFLSTIKPKGKILKISEIKDIVKSWNLPEPFYPMRDYQYKTIKYVYNSKRLTIVSPTSSGKTLLVYGLCKLFLNKVKINKRILVIVPRTQLVDQMYRDFEKYDQNNEDNIKNYIKMIHSEYDKIIEDKHKIIVGTWQSFQNFDPKFFKMFKYLFVDEVHNSADDNSMGVSIKKIISIVRSCYNASYRIGLTGSIYTEDDDEILKRKTIEGLYGPVKVTVSSKLLQDKNFVTKVKIKGVIFDYGIIENEKFTYNKEMKYYAEKNRKIEYIISKLSKTNNNAIVLFKSLDYGKRVYEIIKKELPNKTMHYVDGSVKNKTRLEIQKILDNSDDNIVVGSFKTFGEGISINNIFYVFMSEGYKSRQVVLQAIGRGMRLYKGKEKVIVYDFIDKIIFKIKGLPYAGIAYQHRNKRLGYYKDNNYEFKVVADLKV